VCTNEVKNFPILIENQAANDAAPPSPVTLHKPNTTDCDVAPVAHDSAGVVADFATDAAVKRQWQAAFSRLTDDGVCQQLDASSDKPAMKEVVELADVATNASTQRGDNMSVDPQLHLLDFQLRHILKSSPSVRDDGSSAACDVPGAKTKNVVEGSPSRSFAHSRSVPAAATHDYTLDVQCSRKPPHSGSVRCELTDQQAGSSRTDGNDQGGSAVAHAEASRGRLSRSVERGRRPSYGRKDVMEDIASQPAEADVKKLSVDAVASGGITFGGVEELSHGNIQAEDLPTTNIYLDDHATKAAPYTIASQFYSLGSEADDDCSEGVPDKKMDDDGTCNVSPSACHTADKPRRPITLTRPTLSSTDKAGEQPPCEQQNDSLCWQLSLFTVPAVVTRVLSANGSLTADAFPRPVFSVRSPSSPARLSSDMVESRPRQISIEPAERLHLERDNCMPAAPLAAQEPDGSEEANSGSDVEAAVFTMPSTEAMAQKLATLNVSSEPRGTADGESPRLPSFEAIDGPGEVGQRSEVSEKISSASAELAGIISSANISSYQRTFTRPSADFPNIAKTSKVVPMAVAKKIADCLDVSLGSDKEVKEIMRNGMPAIDMVDRGASGAPRSQFAIVSKTAVERRQSCGNVPNPGTGHMLSPVADNITNVLLPNVQCQSNAAAGSDVGQHQQQACLSAVTHSRYRDDVSDTGSSVLVKTEPFSSPERLPRPPSGRVSKKAAIANRARCVHV